MGFVFLPTSLPEGAAAFLALVLEPGVCSKRPPTAVPPVLASGWDGNGPLAWTEQGGLGSWGDAGLRAAAAEEDVGAYGSTRETARSADSVTAGPC